MKWTRNLKIRLRRTLRHEIRKAMRFATPALSDKKFSNIMDSIFTQCKNLDEQYDKMRPQYHLGELKAKLKRTELHVENNSNDYVVKGVRSYVSRMIIERTPKRDIPKLDL